MKKLLSISYTIVVASLIFIAHVDNARGQKAEDASKGSAGTIVARRGSSVDLGGLASYTDVSIFTFSSTELRQISGRYAAEGSNVHSQAMREYWDKLNARIELQRVNFRNR